MTMIRLHISSAQSLKLSEALESSSRLNITNLDDADVIIGDEYHDNRSIVLGKDILYPLRLSQLIELIEMKASSRIIQYQGLTLDMKDRTLKYSNHEVELTEKEVKIIKLLMQEHFVTKDDLSANVWGHQAGIESNTLDTHLSRLRAKLQSLDEDLEITLRNNTFCISSPCPK